MLVQQSKSLVNLADIITQEFSVERLELDPDLEPRLTLIEHPVPVSLQYFHDGEADFLSIYLYSGMDDISFGLFPNEGENTFMAVESFHLADKKFPNEPYPTYTVDQILDFLNYLRNPDLRDFLNPVFHENYKTYNKASLNKLIDVCLSAETLSEVIQVFNEEGFSERELSSFSSLQNHLFFQAIPLNHEEVQRVVNVYGALEHYYSDYESPVYKESVATHRTIQYYLNVFKEQIDRSGTFFLSDPAFTAANNFLLNSNARFLRFIDEIVVLNFTQETLDDNILEDLISQANHIKQANMLVQAYSAGVNRGTTPTLKIKGNDKSYFFKQIELNRVPSPDFELVQAQKLLEMGFDVQKPVGLLYVQGCLYAGFEYAENSVNLIGLDRMMKPGKKTKLLHKNSEQVYTALGELVRGLFEKGVTDEDMALRNFMAQFEGEELKRVFPIDFEKTIIGEEVSLHQRVCALRKVMDMLEGENKEYFKQGYRSKL